MPAAVYSLLTFLDVTDSSWIELMSGTSWLMPLRCKFGILIGMLD